MCRQEGAAEPIDEAAFGAERSFRLHLAQERRIGTHAVGAVAGPGDAYVTTAVRDIDHRVGDDPQATAGGADECARGHEHGGAERRRERHCFARGTRRGIEGIDGGAGDEASEVADRTQRRAAIDAGDGCAGADLLGATVEEGNDTLGSIERERVGPALRDLHVLARR